MPHSQIYFFIYTNSFHFFVLFLFDAFIIFISPFPTLHTCEYHGHNTGVVGHFENIKMNELLKSVKKKRSRRSSVWYYVYWTIKCNRRSSPYVRTERSPIQGRLAWSALDGYHQTCIGTIMHRVRTFSRRVLYIRERKREPDQLLLCCIGYRFYFFILFLVCTPPLCALGIILIFRRVLTRK